MSNSGEVFNNLVANTYIYSHTSHFEEDLRNRIIYGRQHKINRVFTLDKLIANRNGLLKSISMITEKCNEFYQDMSIIGRDSVIVTNTSIDVHLDGAREFERKYLMGNQSADSNIKNRAGDINDIMVSIDYQQKVYEKLTSNSSKENEIQQKTLDFFNTEIQRSSNAKSKAVKQLANLLTKETGAILKGIDVLFAVKSNRKARKETLTQIQEDILKRFLIELGKDNPDDIIQKVKNNKAELKKLRNSIKREIAGTVFQLKDVAEAMYQVLIEELIKRGVKLSEDEKKAIKQIFLEQLKPALSFVLHHNDDEKLVTFEVGEARLNGLILEQSTALSINVNEFFNMEKIDFSNISKSIAQVTGQQTNNLGQQIKSDITVTGKSGQTYHIQAKNSFSNKDYDQIHIQSNIKVQTFADEIFEDDWEKRIFEFFILNRAFLTRAGLENNSKGKKNRYISAPLKTKNNTDLILMIQFFLNQAIFHMIGSEVQQLIGSDPELQRAKGQKVSYGNLFFVFRKNYLMPVSVFLFDAVNLLNQLIVKAETSQTKPDFLNSIGRLTYSSELQGFSTDYKFKDNVDFIERKKEQIRDTGLKSGQDKYPTNLVKVGSQLGKDMLREAAFKGVNFSLSIQKLDSLLKR